MKLTPLMRQYWDVKSRYPTEIVFFRMGDFYEMFHEDAKIAAPILNIALTSRNKKAADETPMCGIPYHSVAGPIAKLLANGHRVALCDQLEDPAEAKGIVRRDVTRVLSPGMVYDPETLDAQEGNFLCAFDESVAAFLDVSSLEAFYFSGLSPSEVDTVIEMLKPVEFVLGAGQKRGKGSCEAPDSLEGEGPRPCLRLTWYMEKLQGKRPIQFKPRSLGRSLRISENVVRHLEIFENYRGGKEGSFFDAINFTHSSMGARLLKHWLKFPLLDLGEIKKRQDHIGGLLSDSGRLKQLRSRMLSLGDVNRRLGKTHQSHFTSRDLWSLAESLRVGLEVDETLGREREASLQNLTDEIVRVIDEEGFGRSEKVGLVRPGVNEELDELIGLTDDSQKLLRDMEERERRVTGISSLKVRYNGVFGYYIEITHTHREKVPAHYLRKQTLAQAERYFTEELQDLENKILSARARRMALEAQIVQGLRQRVLEFSQTILDAADRWAYWDVVAALAWLALVGRYVRPQLDEGPALALKASRHPVVEKLTPRFVSNDIEMPMGSGLLLTGPNMAGKSTLMRQVALTVVLAQMGSFVPAQSAKLPLFHELHTRIGASDFSAEGLSTFMLEMKESAEILKTASARSLVLLDEIGRGTSTYDGMSLAQALVEFLVLRKQATVLFATHYHELTSLAAIGPAIKNVHMGILEQKGRLSFTYLLKPGPASRSYGIHVAELAGLPEPVLNRARTLLREREETPQPTLFDSPTQTDALRERLQRVEIQKMTPLEALNLLSELHTEVST